MGMSDIERSEAAPECVECGCMYEDTHAEVERLDTAEQQLKAEVAAVRQQLEGAVKENERLRQTADGYRSLLMGRVDEAREYLRSLPTTSRGQ